jgi:Transcriptional antiterminator
VIVVGKGIGFRAKEGMELKSDAVQKIYRMDNQKDTDRLKDLFASLPVEYIELTDEIFGYAKQVLNKRLNERAYITLADHIHFAVERHLNGLDFSNALLNEIRRFYPVEYKIGMHALDIIERRIDVKFPSDEAASIAIHILDAEYDISVKGTFDAAKLLNGILDIVENQAHYAVHDDDYYSERFVTHLKFLAQRVVKNESLSDDDDGLYTLLCEKYQEEIRCGEAIAAYIREKCGVEIPHQEIASLAIHLCRMKHVS